MLDLNTAKKIEINTNSSMKMWDGIWVKTNETDRFGSVLWVRENRPESMPMTNGNIERGISNGFTVTEIKNQMPRMTNDKIAQFNVYQQPSEK